LETKDQTATAMVLLIWELHDSDDIAQKKIRCDNSGDNVVPSHNKGRGPEPPF